MRKLEDRPRSHIGRVLLSTTFACAGFLALCAAVYVAIRPLPRRIRRATAISHEPTVPAAEQSAAFSSIPGPAPQTSVAPPNTASADDAETQHIQAYLDSLYTKSDVASSFRSKAGEDIDCVDFTPSLRSRSQSRAATRYGFPHPCFRPLGLSWFCLRTPLIQWPSTVGRTRTGTLASALV